MRWMVVGCGGWGGGECDGGMGGGGRVGWDDGVWVRDRWGKNGRQGGGGETGGEGDGVRWASGCHRSACEWMGWIECVAGMME